MIDAVVQSLPWESIFMPTHLLSYAKLQKRFSFRSCAMFSSPKFCSRPHIVSLTSELVHIVAQLGNIEAFISTL